MTKQFQFSESTMQSHSAIIGRTGSGKTYAGKFFVEKLLAENKRVCVLDPTGAWWGLRSSADGKREGFPVVVFGGEHADIKINEHSGAALGEMLGTQHIPAVIDLSDTMLGERHRFVERFAEAIFRVNKAPLHLIIDEADEFAPQGGQPGTERMLGAIDRIVRRGRIKGFRVMMITQRPAVLNKNVLTQASTLIAMRLPAPQDRKAVEDWIKGQADVEKGREVLQSLPKLERGEGWVWAAEADVLERVRFPKITTFDSGRTPSDGEEIEQPKRLADIDLSAVTQALAAATAEAKGKDPVELKKRIKELEEQLLETDRKYRDELGKPTTIHANERIEELERENTAFYDENRKYRGMIQSIADIIGNGTPLGSGAASGSREVMPGAASAGRKTAPSGRVAELDEDAGPAPAARAPHVRVEPPEQSGSGGGLTSPQRKVLWALAWWATIGTHGPTRPQLAAVAGYSPTSGGFGNLLSQLSSAGLIQYPNQGAVSLTLNGRSVAEKAKPPRSLAELHSYVRSVLDNPQAKVLDALLKSGGKEMSREELAKRTGYSHTSGGYGNLLSKLSSLGLITRPHVGFVKPAGWLFPEGLKGGAA